VSIEQVAAAAEAGRVFRMGRGHWRAALLCVLAVALWGCGMARWGAPIEGRGGGGTITGPTYTVQPGDTLIAIGWQAGLDHVQLAAWNRLKSPDKIYVGQVLRLTPPDGETASAPTTPPLAAAASVPAASSRETAPPPSPVATTSKPVAGGRLRWQWPTTGPVIQGFAASDSSRKGVKIGGRPGQPIVAAESGEVVYSGSGLVGYGPLIIIKHNDNYLSAYGHNRKLLVRQGDQITKGKTIAEMGLAAGEPLLHFEIRRDGDPVDPLALLPPR